jgi:hypothetical protein
MNSPDVAWYDVIDEEIAVKDYKAIRLRNCPRLTAMQLEALWQLRMTVWDGYLISKTARDQLVDKGLVARCNGWQFITREGMCVLDTYGLLKDDRYGTRGDAGNKLWILKPHQFQRLREEGLLI